MAFTYRWSDLLVLVKKQVKNIPTDTVDLVQCNLVSAEISQRLPWKFLQQTIADGQIPLIDGVQDYDPPFNLFRLTDASLRCLSANPPQDRNIILRESLPVDFARASPYAITSVALQAGAGKLRLNRAVAIPQSELWELHGQYQINTRVTSTSQIVWFDDRYVNVAIEGLKYQYFMLADDPRAGATTGTWPDAIGYSGQLAQFMGAIKRMASAEDIGGDMQTMPDEPLGIASRQYGAMVAGYGFGGGNGTNAASRGLVSLNGDTTAAQTLVGGYGISVHNTAIGTQMIEFIGTITPPTPPAPVVNYMDNELVGGGGTSWSLLEIPNPAQSLQLFQYLTGFGQILLAVNVDYTLFQNIITTTNSLPAGVLRAYYRW